MTSTRWVTISASELQSPHCLQTGLKEERGHVRPTAELCGDVNFVLVCVISQTIICLGWSLWPRGLDEQSVHSLLDGPFTSFFPTLSSCGVCYLDTEDLGSKLLLCLLLSSVFISSPGKLSRSPLSYFGLFFFTDAWRTRQKTACVRQEGSRWLVFWSRRACCQKLPEIEETVGHNWLWQLGHDHSPWEQHLKANLHVTSLN